MWFSICILTSRMTWAQVSRFRISWFGFEFRHSFQLWLMQLNPFWNAIVQSVQATWAHINNSGMWQQQQQQLGVHWFCTLDSFRSANTISITRLFSPLLLFLLPLDSALLSKTVCDVSPERHVPRSRLNLYLLPGIVIVSLKREREKEPRTERYSAE